MWREMPSFRQKYKKPWVAAVHVSREKKTYTLGSYMTREEAAAAEDEFRKTKDMPGRGWPESARERSKQVRAEKKQQPKPVSLSTRLPNTKWRKPDPLPQGMSREVLQERARLRAVESIRY